MIVSSRLRYRFEYTRKSAAFGIPNNRVDTDNLTLCDYNNLCGGEIIKLMVSKVCNLETTIRQQLPSGVRS